MLEKSNIAKKFEMPMHTSEAIDRALTPENDRAEMFPNKDALPTRETLLSRLRNWDDRDSWNEFFELYWKLIYNAALRAGLTDAEAQDVVQDTVICVSKSMPGFRYERSKGSFKAWLFRLTKWRIQDQFRKRSQSVSFEREIGLADFPDPAGTALEQLWDAEWEKNLIDAALERVKRAIDPRQFQLFDLAVLQQWSVKKIRESLNVSAAFIYVAKYRVSALVRKELKYLRSREHEK